MPWRINGTGQKEFAGGTEDFKLAAKAAASCAGFTTDDEDEQVSDDPVSCYNCRYRRWAPKSIFCLNPRVAASHPPE
jgi:hypothetical protein